jgi:hypothetical protein
MIHTNIGYICAPYVVSMSDRESSEKVGILFMFWIGNGGIDIFLVRVECVYTEYSHQARYLTSTYAIPFYFKHFTELSRSQEWMFCIESIQPSEKDILFWIDNRGIVVAGTRNTEKFYLTRDRKMRKIRINE